MSSQSILGKRVLVTQADRFMGPVLCEVFASHGATVIASTDPLESAGAPAAIVAEAGQVDVLNRQLGGAGTNDHRRGSNRGRVE